MRLGQLDTQNQQLVQVSSEMSAAQYAIEEFKRTISTGTQENADLKGNLERLFATMRKAKANETVALRRAEDAARSLEGAQRQSRDAEDAEDAAGKLGTELSNKNLEITGLRRDLKAAEDRSE